MAEAKNYLLYRKSVEVFYDEIDRRLIAFYAQTIWFTHLMIILDHSQIKWLFLTDSDKHEAEIKNAA